MNLKYEKKKLAEGYKYIIGCDEVGRGCLAGPVVAAAVVLPNLEHRIYKEIKDSKKLTKKKREELSIVIKEIAQSWSIAEVSSVEIDKINIHNASLLAMRKAVDGLNESVILRPSASEAEESLKLCSSNNKGSFASSNFKSLLLAQDDTRKTFVFIDGKFTIPNFSEHQQAIISGDNKVLSIAAASIIAKVYRDELMEKFDKQYPAYYLAKHKGYATTIHREAIIKVGLSPIHRLTFCRNFYDR